MGFGLNVGGVLILGGILVNLIVLFVVRVVKSKWVIWMEGGYEMCFVFLVLEEVYYCVDWVVWIMGWGEMGIIKIFVDDYYCMWYECLFEYLVQAKEEGLEVIVVVGSVCFIFIGFFDDLNVLVDFCEVEGFWLYVDGVYGVVLLFFLQYKVVVDGLECVDLVVMDFYKMLFIFVLVIVLIFKNGLDSYWIFSQWV